MDILDTALFWLNQGVATVPLVYRSKQPAIKWTPYRTRLPSEVEIEEWYQDRRNIALVTGWQNLVVLDFDSPESYAAWLVWQLERQPEVVQTYRVQSRRGIHVYYYLTEPADLPTIAGAPFEVKAAGKLCTTPPSVHESGRKYTSLDDPTRIRVVRPEQILNYSLVEFAPIVFPTRSKFAPASSLPADSSPIEAIKESVPLLSLFPTARKLDDRFYLADCPIHGHKANFWIDTQLRVCGCYTGCNSGRAMNIVQLWTHLNNCDTRSALADLERLL